MPHRFEFKLYNANRTRKFTRYSSRFGPTQGRITNASANFAAPQVNLFSHFTVEPVVNEIIGSKPLVCLLNCITSNIVERPKARPYCYKLCTNLTRPTKSLHGTRQFSDFTITGKSQKGLNLFIIRKAHAVLFSLKRKVKIKILDL
jgi:hypothetical protein